MDNLIPSISKGAQGQKKQKNKGSKPVQQPQVNPQVVGNSTPSCQGQQCQANKPQAV